MPEIADSLQGEVSPDFILSPDKGAIARASEVAGLIGCEFSYLEKTRIDAHTMSILQRILMSREKLWL